MAEVDASTYVYMGLVEVCAPAALYLCSDKARYVTGSEIIVDGEIHL